MSGCWYSFSRCVGNRGDEPNPARYRTTEVESIKFENLLMLEQKEQDSRVPLINEEELEHVRGGRLDRLAEEQTKRDQERDQELRRQEEQLRREEEAYYASKRAAAHKMKHTITTQPHGTANRTSKQSSSLPSWLVQSPPSALGMCPQPVSPQDGGLVNNDCGTRTHAHFIHMLYSGAHF